MRSTILITALLSLTALAADAVTISKAAFLSDAIHDNGPTGQADYYGSGNDDDFSEYGIASFSFSPVDFGGSVVDITSLTYTLTVNDRNFSSGTQTRFFYVDDAFGGDYSSLSFNTSLINGLDSSQYTTAPVDLGIYNITADLANDSGVEEVFTLDISSIESSLISKINSGQEFSLLITAVNANDDITFSGVGNTFDPGDPTLTFTANIPEPSSGLLLALAALLPFGSRRR